MTSHEPIFDTEAPTGRPPESLQDWRRLLTVYDALAPKEREALIRLSAAWAELDTDKRVLMVELARHLRAAQY